ncbi:phosphoribosyl-AMP cyclohydrolase [bacterium]|nr:phosphoribosyl-AMP cyclohydrolase [bacterium]
MDTEDKNAEIFVSGIKFDDKGLVPAIIQDWQNGQVLMMAYMNRESLLETIKTGRTVFWSRSRRCIWRKGETSGHIQKIKELLYDCDMDSLLFKVEQVGPSCHTGNRTCFYRYFDKRFS